MQSFNQSINQRKPNLSPHSTVQLNSMHVTQQNN